MEQAVEHLEDDIMDEFYTQTDLHCYFTRYLPDCLDSVISCRFEPLYLIMAHTQVFEQGVKSQLQITG